jgi:hypothetical protein
MTNLTACNFYRRVVRFKVALLRGFLQVPGFYPVDVISIVTRLKVYGRLPTPVGASYFHLLRKVRTSFGAHPASYSMGTGLLSPR